MNKILMNARARNHIRFFPMPGTVELPEGEGERIRWCEREYKELERADDAERLFLAKNKSKGYLVSVWSHKSLYWLVYCLRDHVGTFTDTIYVSDARDDLLAIAKFLRDNVEQIGSDYKKQLTDACDWLVRQTLRADADDDA